MEGEKAMDDPTAADAAWKKIQQNTFTRWCNEHLKNANQYIYSLETDLCDGLKLIALLQVLSHKKIAKYNKKPTFRPQKLENIAIALKFIEDQEIKLVNIDASDLFKGNLKLILGLIWTLILKYQISIPMMDDDDGSSGVTPKQALLGWVKSKLPPEVRVNNFNADWNNGIALSSLVDACAPGLFPEWEDLDPKDALNNCTEAMKRADDWLGVPQVLTPEEISNPNVDELSVMTYVSYFPSAKLKPGAPIKTKLSDAGSCNAYGPGLEPEGVMANAPADFTVVTTGSSRGKLNVSVMGPGKQQIDCLMQDNHNNTFSCQYVPPKPGTYDVLIRIGNHHIPKSPFRVKVASDLDVKKVYARGPGIEPTGVVVGRPAEFEIVASGAGSGEPHIDVIDPKGNKKTEIKVEDKGNGIFAVQYLPLLTGKYVICVKFGGEEIAKSPFRVQVDHPATKVKLYGPGLEPGLKVSKPAVFTVDCKEAGDGNLDISIEGPGKAAVPVDVKDNGDGTFTCTYRPVKAGTYIVTVFLERQQVPTSPVKVNIASGVDLSKIRAWGPGLEKGVAGSPAEFYVEAKGAPIDALSFAIEGPGEAKFEVTETGPQKCTVKYYPTEPGQYTVHVMAEEMDIPHSPFKVKIHPKGDAKKVYAEGPGLRPGCCTGKPATFTIYAQKAGGSGKVDVTCTDEDGNPVEVKVKDNKDDTYAVSYMPVKPGKHTVIIKFAGDDIDRSPFEVPITPYSDPSKVKAHGPGLKGGKRGKPCEFKIDASEAGEGGIGLTIEGPTESKIDCDDHGNGSCSVTYYPEEDGDYVINILFADTHIPGSPFKAIVSSDFDASKVKAYGPGLEPGNKAGRPCEITIDAKSAGRAKLQVEVTDDAGKPVNVDLQESEPGLYNAAYHPDKPGKYTILITFGGKPIPKSPFKVTVEPSADPSKVRVSGPGIEPTGVKSNEPTYFEIDASDAGDGNVDVSIEPEGRNMPKVTDIKVEDGKKPNTYKVRYVAPKEGPYLITVKFAGKSVPKSPFKVGVKPGVGGIRCYGPGLEEPLVGQEVPFTVDCGPDASDEKPEVEIVGPDGKKTKPTVKSTKKGVYDVTWTPKQPGKHKVIVLYGGEEVPDSPFNVNAVEKGDASKVKASGPGLEHAFIRKPNTFDIDTRAAGPGNLGLAIEGPAESKITCEENPDGTHSVTYTPVEEGEYDINIKFGDEHIPESPFKVPAEKAVDASKVKCSGPGLEKVPASLPTHFTVDAKKAEKAPLDVEIIGPDRKKKEPKIKNNGDGTYDVEYTPDVEGKYTIGVKYGGNTVPQSPFRVTAVPTGDASKCKVSGPGVKRAPVGLPAKFKVDATKAGPGKVTASAKNPKGEEIPVTVKEMGDGVFACEFVPEVPGEHEVDVLFGGVPVKGSPFHPEAVEPVAADKVKTPGLEELLYDSPAVETPVEGLVDTSDAGKGKLDATLLTPAGKKMKVGVSDNGDGTYTMNFTPKEVGHYVLTILFEGSNVPGSPFEFEVVEGGPRKVKVYGPGIRKGFTGRPNCFTVDTKNAGPGGLSLAVEGPSQADINCIDNGDGTCLVTYTPDTPGEYDIIVKFADEDVPGSPFKVKVVEDEPIYEVGRPCDVEMEPNNVSMPEDQPVISGVLANPHGKEKPIGVKKGPKDGPDNAVIASFTPEEAGKHDVGVKKRGKDVDGSPKPVYVRDKPIIGKPCEVPMECADVERPNDIPYTKATLTRPNDKEEPLDLKVYPDGTLSVTFIPKEPGRHLINVRKHGKHVDDSPYVIMVEEPRENVPTVGYPVDVNMDVPNLKLPEELDQLESTLKRPNGKEEPVSVKLGPDDTIAVAFTPREPGEHILSVKKKGKHIPDSPFSIMVAGKALKGPVAGQPCDVNIDSPDIRMPRDLKDLEAFVRSPSGKKSPADCKEGPDGTLAVGFTPKETGKHLVDVLKRGKPVEGSPFPVMVSSPEDAPIVPTVDEPCECNLDIPDVSMPKDLDKLEAFVTPPNGKKEPADVKEGPNGTVCVDFTPKEPGKHKIDVLKNGRPVKGSPFEVAVEPKEEPITSPTVGHPCDVNLDIPGVKLPDDLKNLKATVQRPNGQKEPVEVTEGPDETIAISFTPKEPGKHLIDVQKNGRPVKGSPFEIMVEEGKPSGKGPTVGNPCDVNLDIDGVDIPDDLKDISAVLARPNGEETPVNVKEGPGQTLSVEFVPEQPGKHLLHVKKKRRPVNGSPFTIMVEEAQPRRKTPLVGRPYTLYMRLTDARVPDDLPDITAYVISPSGQKLRANVSKGPGFTLAITFLPPEPGVYLIFVQKKRTPLRGCPFRLTVVIQPADKRPKKGQPNTQCLHPEDVVMPDDLPDLKAYVESPSGKEEPAEVSEGPDHSLAISFQPKEVGKHLIHVKKRRRPIKESPFEVMVVADEPEQVPTVGSETLASVPASGLTPEDMPDVKGYIERPSGKEEPVDVKLGPDDSLIASFVPEEPGKHLLHIKKRRRPIDGSPFPIMVEEAKGPSVGSPCDVNLEIQGLNLPDDLPLIKGVLSRPSGAKEDLPCTVGPNNSLSVNFTPREPGEHLIEVTKRGKPLPESPFKVIVEESVPAEKEPTVGSECDINLDIPNLNLPDDLKNIKGTLKRPSSDKEEPLTVRANPDNTLGVAFTPKEPGPHEVGILKHGQHVNSSPFIINVQPSSPDQREAGPTVGSPCDVSIEIPGIRIPQDLKHLTGSLSRPNGKEEPLELKAGPDQTLLISFVPQEPGKHLINIKRGGQHVPSSPVVVMVDKAKPKKPGQQCDVGLEIPGIKLPEDLKYLTGTVETPSGNKEPVELQPGPNNKTILVSFLPKEVGKHKLHIKKNGSPVGGSPFEIVVKPEDVVSTEPDASKVRIYGKGLNGGPPHKRCEFVVDTRDAGYGGLGLSIEGPSKVEINCVDNEDGTCTVDFTPTEEGTYTINVTYADEHVPGSPVKIRISDRRPRQVEEDVMTANVGGDVESTPDVYSDILAFPRAKPQQDFVIKFAGSKDLRASVTRPSGIEDDAEVVETGKDTYTVRFVPKETGEHLVHVKHRSRDIPGSPFKVLVETPAGGAPSCRAFGPGLEGGVANQPCKFTVVTRDAGPGGLAVAVEGPAKAEIQCHDNGDGSCDITWYPVEAGEYTIHIRFADEPIPGSAFNVNVVPEDEKSAMSMQQFKDQVLRMGQQASFAVQMKGKRGKISASVVAPTGAEIECTVVELEQGNYAVRFVPRELGDHRVNVFLDGQHIPGSPFVVRVGGIEGDPSRVRAYGPGLRGGVVNRPAHFVVNALEAGSGALALSIDGPAKVKMNCVEQEDGTYQVSYTPTVAGSYEISIRFAGQHIPGSPYKVHIATTGDAVDGLGQSDASKCTSRGPGLKHANVGQAATFTVDAGDAGRGMIMVGVEGPVIPAKEILVRHTGNNVYSVNYILEEPGEYVLSVLWGDAHIPGSPFHVTV